MILLHVFVHVVELVLWIAHQKNELYCHVPVLEVSNYSSLTEMSAEHACFFHYIFDEMLMKI